MAYQKILIAVDNSKLSMKAAEHGMKLSSQLGASVAVVYVIDTAKINKDAESGSLPQHQIAKLKKEASESFNWIESQFPGCAFERFLPEGKPSQGVVDTATEWGADLVVMGTQGKSGLKRLLVGSTAENVLRLSNIPLLVVPSKA